MMNGKDKNNILSIDENYQQFSNGIYNLFENARRFAGRAVNVILTASYWEIGRRIIEYEQKGKKKQNMVQNYYSNFLQT